MIMVQLWMKCPACCEWMMFCGSSEYEYLNFLVKCGGCEKEVTMRVLRK